MPNSSRRKQSKPQHVLNEEEEDVKAGNPLVTSTHTTTDDQPTQEGQYGSKGTGQFLWENGKSEGIQTYTIEVPVEDDLEASEIEGQVSTDKVEGENWNEALPHDLSMKAKPPEVEIETRKNDLMLEDEIEDDGIQPLYTPPSEELAERFCVYCNKVMESPLDLERHLHTHIRDRPFCCRDCSKYFKSKQNLQYHEFSQHGRDPSDSNIAQQYRLLRKRSFDEAHQKTDRNHLYPPSQADARSSSSPNQVREKLTNLSPSPALSDMASKRPRMEEMASSSFMGTGHSGSETVLDLKMAQAMDAMDSCDSQDLTRGNVICSVCSKVFPKQSDLKRHMMCHTGEKPFRCEYCNKPFRAKSSMHYHLKATHGIEIQLSPGLEERFQRMKTRAHMSLLQRGGLAGLPYPYKESIDIEDIEDDNKSTDSSFFHNSGIGSDLKEPNTQGLFNNTGIDNKEAIDLSATGTSREKVQDLHEQLSEGEIVIAADAPFKKNKISVQNETVVITRLDGYNVMNGENATIFKCYLCGKMFPNLSSMQCHLSLHFEKQIISFECCFCNEVFQFKTQMRNHIRRKHKSQFYRNAGRERNTAHETKDGRLPNSTHPKSSSHKSKHVLQCRFCRRAFISKISLDKHVKLHFLKRNCFCRICGKSFQHYTSLQLHISRFHWKTGQKSNSNWLQGKFNFFNTSRFHVDSHDGVVRPDNCEPLDLIKSKAYPKDQKLPQPNPGITVVMPQSPMENGELSDTGASHHSSENNWSESLSDNAIMEYDETGAEIKVAPKRSLMPFRRENSPRSKTSRKSTPTHIPPQNQQTSDNSLPLNFVKNEAIPQDSNNNESSSNHEPPDHLSPDANTSIRDSVFPGYNMNATNHLLMAKALAAHQSLAQHLNHNSQSLIYPPNHLPPSLAAMSQMMSLPVSVQVPNETRAGTSKSPSPASHSSSKSDTSPEDRDNKETVRETLVGYPRVQWGQQKGLDWTFNMYCPPDTGHTDGRKVTSLSRTHSRNIYLILSANRADPDETAPAGAVSSGSSLFANAGKHISMRERVKVTEESLCKPTNLSDGRTVYKCPFCSKEFVSFSDINRHMDFHEDIRPYKCQYCDYYARTNSQLKVHMMRHQGIREFCCKLCNYKGVTQSDLNRHMKSQIHMLKSRNACTYCGEGFVTPKNLEKHLDGNCIVKMQKLNGSLDIRLQESVA